MAFQQLVDSIPIVGFFGGYVVVALVALECGYRLGCWWQNRTHEEKEGPTPMIVGSLLALMAFLLAITMGMASERFDRRRALVLEEANALGTTYLRAGYLPAQDSARVQVLLREYVPLRIATDDMEDNHRKIARSVDVQAELWSVAEDSARAMPGSYVVGLFIESLNDVIDMHSKRVIASIYGRVPATILLLLLFGSMLTLAMVGYSTGLTRRRSPVTAIVLIAVLSAVITLVFDLDRPQGGFLEVSQQPLIDLQQNIRGS
ncbi:MAG: hypothetical protein R3F30_09190 [Planctomycetota bacterium]